MSSTSNPCPAYDAEVKEDGLCAAYALGFGTVWQTDYSLLEGLL